MFQSLFVQHERCRHFIKNCCTKLKHWKYPNCGYLNGHWVKARVNTRFIFTFALVLPDPHHCDLSLTTFRSLVVDSSTFSSPHTPVISVETVLLCMFAAVARHYSMYIHSPVAPPHLYWFVAPVLSYYYGARRLATTISKSKRNLKYPAIRLTWIVTFFFISERSFNLDGFEI